MSYSVLLSRHTAADTLCTRSARASTPPPARVWPRLSADAPRRDAVVDAMRHAWGAYATHAFGHDELDPLTNKSKGMSFCDIASIPIGLLAE